MSSSSSHPPTTSHTPPKPSPKPSTTGTVATTPGTHAAAPPPDPTTTTQPTSSPRTTSTSTRTTVSVTVVKPTASTVMSFVTVLPDSTLASALSLTVTGADGHTSLTAPPVVTLISTSTEANGSVIKTTHVVANPNPNVQSATRTGILHNEGALAGIFVVVGIAAAAILGLLVWCIRRRKKQARRKEWMSSLRPQQPEPYSPNPFQDPPADNSYVSPPFMRSAHQDHSDLLWGQPGSNPNNRSSDHSNGDHSSSGHGNATSSVYPDTYPIMKTSGVTTGTSAYPMADTFAAPGIGYGYAMDKAGHVPPQNRFPQRMSTPSLYPASLPGDDNDQQDPEAIRSPPAADPVTFTRSTGRFTLPPISTQRLQGDSLSIPRPLTTSSAAPPRPPRSHLRKNSTRSVDFSPLTPPDSQIHTPSKTPPTPSPISETRTQDVLTRRTLLDIRSRSLIS